MNLFTININLVDMYAFIVVIVFYMLKFKYYLFMQCANGNLDIVLNYIIQIVISIFIVVQITYFQCKVICAIFTYLLNIYNTYIKK